MSAKFTRGGGEQDLFSSKSILFEVGIPNLVCECILGWQSVTCHFGATVTLTSGLISTIVVSRAYLLYYLR